MVFNERYRTRQALPTYIHSDFIGTYFKRSESFRFSIMAMLILICCFGTTSCTGPTTGCDDYFKQLGINIAAKYQSCKYVEEAQMDYYEVRYSVEHRDYQEVESFLVERYGMSELYWACCGFETRGWTVFTAEGIEYSVHMFSEEFEFNGLDHEKKFMVILRQYTRINI